MKKLREHKEALLEALKDPKYAELYLSVALDEYENDRNIESFLMALRDIVEASCSLSES